MVREDRPGDGCGEDEAAENAQEWVCVEDKDKEIIEDAEAQEGQETAQYDDLAFLPDAVGGRSYGPGKQDNTPEENGYQARAEYEDAGGALDKAGEDENGAPDNADGVGCQEGGCLPPRVCQPVDEMEKDGRDERQRALKEDGIEWLGDKGAAMAVMAEVPEEEYGVHHEEGSVEGVPAGMGQGQEAEEEV